MVALGEAHGMRTIALLTDMSTPLGRAVGNAVEVAEAVEVLAGGGPADVVELTVTLAREMLAAVGLTAQDPADALADGRAMDVWRAMVTAQGGDPDAPLPQAREVEYLRAETDGVVTRWRRAPSAPPRGGWAPGAPGRKTRWTRPPGWCCTARSGTGSGPGTCSVSCGPTIRRGCPRPRSWWRKR